MFGARSSRWTRTRSVPSIIKYPPGSSASSPASISSFLLKPERWQSSERSIIGISAISTSVRSRSFPSIISPISRKIFDAYVRFLRRASIGRRSCSAPSASTIVGRLIVITPNSNLTSSASGGTTAGIASFCSSTIC